MNEAHVTLTQDVARTELDLVLTFCRHIFDNDSILPVSIGDRRLNSGSYDLLGKTAEFDQWFLFISANRGFNQGVNR